MAKVPNRYLPVPPVRGVGTVHRGFPTGGGGGSKPTRRKEQAQQNAIQRAVMRVATSLGHANPTIGRAQAVKLAQVILSRPGVQIGAGKKGDIFFQGKRYSPQAWATSPIAKLASGATASARNQAAIQGSPDYQQALAALGLNRDQSVAGLQDQQRQALIEYGDPTFAGSDAQTAAIAGANPFSTQNLMRQAYQQNLSTAAQNANRLGVASGGGAISGQQAAQKSYAGQVQDAVSKLQQLLGQIGSQTAAADQTYNLGKTQAATDAYNTLLASGYHAAQAPTWAPGTIQVRAVKGYGAKKPGGVGGGGMPPVAIGTGGHPVVGPPPPYNGGNPPTLNTGPIVPNRTLAPTATGLAGATPIDLQALYRRYGIYG